MNFHKSSFIVYAYL